MKMDLAKLSKLQGSNFGDTFIVRVWKIGLSNDSHRIHIMIFFDVQKRQMLMRP